MFSLLWSWYFVEINGFDAHRPIIGPTLCWSVLAKEKCQNVKIGRHHRRHACVMIITGSIWQKNGRQDAFSASKEAPPELTIGSLTKSQYKKLQNISSKYEIWYTLGVLNLLISYCRSGSAIPSLLFLDLLLSQDTLLLGIVFTRLVQCCQLHFRDICVLLAGLRANHGCLV
jgi:hypothetical protein